MIFANWKENGSIAMIEDWTYDFLKATDDELLNNVDVGIAPSYIHIQLFKDLLEKSKIMIGAQDVDYGINARTSKVSASMLKDFDINSRGTINLLEMTKNYCFDAPFIFMSTNKVYGDNPNNLPLIEKSTRWEIKNNHSYKNGITESMSIDNCIHSFFGASKLFIFQNIITGIDFLCIIQPY